MKSSTAPGLAADAHQNALAIVENLADEVEFARNAPDRRAKSHALHPAAHPDFHRDELRLLPDVLQQRHGAASHRSTRAGEIGSLRRGSVDHVHGSSSAVAEVLEEIGLEGAANKAGDRSGEPERRVDQRNDDQLRIHDPVQPTLLQIPRQRDQQRLRQASDPDHRGCLLDPDRRRDAWNLGDDWNDPAKRHLPRRHLADSPRSGHPGQRRERPWNRRR